MAQTARPMLCTSHEHREATFVCQHLGSGGVGLGLNLGVNPDNADELWPMAWCDACEAKRATEGEWTDHALEFADLWLLCIEHYDLVRRRNWFQNDAAYAKLSTRAHAYLDRQQADLRERFSLGDHGSFTLNARSGEVAFSNRTSSSLIAKFQIVGDLSTEDKTWTWSWASPLVPESVKQRMRIVRAHGEEHSYRELASAAWPAADADAWEMTAIAAYLLDAQGANRLSHDGGALFVVVSDVRWEDDGQTRRDDY